MYIYICAAWALPACGLFGSGRDGKRCGWPMVVRTRVNPIYMYIYIYVYVYIYKYIYVYMHMYICIYMYMSINVNI